MPNGMNQRSAQQDRDPGVTGVRVDLCGVGLLCVSRIHGEVTCDRVLDHRDAVQLQERGHHLDVLDFRNVAQR